MTTQNLTQSQMNVLVRLLRLARARGDLVAALLLEQRLARALGDQR